MKKNKKSFLTLALVLFACGVLFQNCAAAPPPDVGQLSNSSYSPDAYTCVFGGQILNSGQSVVAYQASSVASGTCAAVSQTRTCANGMLSGSYSSPSCIVQSANGTASCSIYGQTVAHGQAVTAYQASSVTGSACVAEQRICTNGILSGNYQYLSCVVDCSFNGAVIGHNTSVIGFSTPSVPSGSACSTVSQTRTCNMGSLSGSFAYSSCAVQSPTGGTASCTFNGQTILNGASVTAYSMGAVPYTMTCSGVSQQRTCTNGVLSGTYQYSTCFRERYNCYTSELAVKTFSEAIADCP